MRRYLALALLAATALAGCSGTKNRSLDSVHQPIVARTDYVFDVAAVGDRIAPGDAQRLTGWFDSLRLRYGDRVAVDTQGYGYAARGAVGAIVARYGLLIDDTPPITQGPIAQGSVRVIVSRMSASVPGCPDFSRNGPSEFEGNNNSNYGCATNATFAAMVADPHDLIQGRGGDNSGDVDASGRAIRAYRAGTIKALKEESTRSSR